MCLIHKNTLEGYSIVCSKNAIQTTSVLRSWKFFRIYSKYSHWSIAYITYLSWKTLCIFLIILLKEFNAECKRSSVVIHFFLNINHRQ